MTGVKIRLPYPHAGQREVRRKARRFNWLSAGRRWRKTTLLATLAIEAAARGNHIIWGAPTFDQVRVAWSEFTKAAGSVGDFKQSTMVMALPTGGAVTFRSLDDPDNARGHTADGIVIDEAGDVKEQAWYEVLRPMLIDTGGWAWCIGTPRGRNWFWREWLSAKDRADSASWQIPTKGCRIERGKLLREPHPLENPDVPWSEIEQIWQTTPEHIFRQEIMAEFLEGEGTVFRNILPNLYQIPDDPLLHAGHYIVAGVDWGKLNDYTAISIFCGACMKELAHDRFNQIDYHYQRQRVTALVDKWQAGAVLAESNAMGEPVIDELRREGMPISGFQTTAQSKAPLIENLALAFEKNEAQWLDDKIWTAELEAYEVRTNAVTGRPTYSAPDGLHDDTVMARALAYRLAHTPPAAGEIAEIDLGEYRTRPQKERLWQR